MSFNASKCFQMRITHKRKPIQVNYRLGNTTLEEVKHNPYLGVELSKDLSWATHIDQITSKASLTLTTAIAVGALLNRRAAPENPT